MGSARQKMRILKLDIAAAYHHEITDAGFPVEFSTPAIHFDLCQACLHEAHVHQGPRWYDFLRPKHRKCLFSHCHCRIPRGKDSSAE
jgi:hypothetical protein